jgi:hypothetical protein
MVLNSVQIVTVDCQSGLLAYVLQQCEGCAEFWLGHTDLGMLCC